jgi:hypothetical protein
VATQLQLCYPTQRHTTTLLLLLRKLPVRPHTAQYCTAATHSRAGQSTAGRNAVRMMSSHIVWTVSWALQGVAHAAHYVPSHTPTITHSKDRPPARIRVCHMANCHPTCVAPVLPTNM